MCKEDKKVKERKWNVKVKNNRKKDAVEVGKDSSRGGGIWVCVQQARYGK
jgi:hypothetical protein